MTESVTVVVREDDFVALDSLSAFHRGSVKQKALHFDRIAVPDFIQGLDLLRRAPVEDKDKEGLEFFVAELEWLQSEGVVVDLDYRSLTTKLTSDVGTENARQLLFSRTEDLVRMNEVIKMSATELAELKRQMSVPRDFHELTADEFRAVVRGLKTGETSAPSLARMERLAKEMNQIALRALSRAMEREIRM